MNKLVFVIILIFSCLELFAQTGTVRGFVYEETSGEPAMFSNVFLGKGYSHHHIYTISKFQRNVKFFLQKKFHLLHPHLHRNLHLQVQASQDHLQTPNP